MAGLQVVDRRATVGAISADAVIFHAVIFEVVTEEETVAKGIDAVMGTGAMATAEVKANEGARQVPLQAVSLSQAFNRPIALKQSNLPIPFRVKR